MNRTCFSTKTFRQRIHIHKRGEILVVHFFRLWVENQRRTCIFTQSAVTLHVAWITFQIFTHTKLHRIDKHADNNLIIFRNGSVNQALMTFMQISHGRHKTDHSRRHILSAFHTDRLLLLKNSTAGTCCACIFLFTYLYDTCGLFRAAHSHNPLPVS